MRRAALALLAGAVAALTLPPWGLWPLLAVSLPLLVWLIDGLAGLRTAFLTGWLFGFGYFTVAFYWIGAAFLVDAETYLWMMPFMVGGLAAGMAMYWGLAVLLARLVWRAGVSRLLLLAALLALAELLRGRLFTGFPWGAPGLMADGMGPLAQVAALTGMTGLTFLVLLWAMLPALLGDGRWRGLVILLSIPALWLYGTLRLAEPEAADVTGVRLRLVQPATVLKPKWDENDALPAFKALLALSGADPAGAPPTHVIWPESAVTFLLAESPVALTMVDSALADGVTLITGTLRRDAALRDGNGDPLIYNSMLVFDGTARLLAAYDKWRLVPGGEFLPFESILGPLGFRKVVTMPGSFGSGAGPVTIALPDAPPAGFLICYEAIFPHGLVDPEKRPAWLVNVTNDTWFGTTSGPYQHLAQARMRAIEQGLPLLRAANTGISAVIDAKGRIRQSLPLGARGVLDAALPAALPPTPYARWGDWIVLALIAAALAFWPARHFLAPLNPGSPPSPRSRPAIPAWRAR